MLQNSKYRGQKIVKNGYSGKKRTNTMKTEIIIEEGGRILSVSKSYRERFSHKETRKISTTR